MEEVIVSLNQHSIMEPKVQQNIKHNDLELRHPRCVRGNKMGVGIGIEHN
jgi:hypothetical protein